MNPGDYASPGKWGGNVISSARALPLSGTSAIALFKDDGFRGRMLVLYDTSYGLTYVNFNNKLSSFIITGGRWTLYEHAKLKAGVSHYYGVGQDKKSSLSDVGGNDKISSVKKNY